MLLHMIVLYFRAHGHGRMTGRMSMTDAEWLIGGMLSMCNEGRESRLHQWRETFRS